MTKERSGAVLWVTGLPQSGKSTFGAALAERLRAGKCPTAVLDGDAVRGAIVPPYGYDPASRDAFYASLANLAGLLARQGLVVVVPATAHADRYRQQAKASVGVPFVLVHLAVDRETAAERDRKGLYRAAAEGKAPNLPDDSYEPPPAPDVVATGGRDEQALSLAERRVLDLLGAIS